MQRQIRGLSRIVSWKGCVWYDAYITCNCVHVTSEWRHGKKRYFSKFFETVAKFTYFGTTVTNEYYVVHYRLLGYDAA